MLTSSTVVQINFQPRVVGVSTSLYLIASNETAGRYYCKAHSIGFPEISAEALVILKGSPKILSPSEQYPVDADVYEIECLAISVPKAKHVSWAFNGVLIDLDKDVDFSLRQTVTHDTIKSTLRIEENHLKYFGVYSCTVINKYGSDTLDISYMQRSKSKPPVELLRRQALRIHCANQNMRLPPKLSSQFIFFSTHVRSPFQPPNHACLVSHQKRKQLENLT